MAPRKMKALVTPEKGKVLIKEVDVPKLEKGEVLVKIVACAQNPTDWKHVHYFHFKDAVTGCDGAGVVEEIGPGVEPGVRKIGERVAIFLHGNVGRGGTFAEYATIDAKLCIPIPDSMSFEDASTLGVATFTTCQTLFQAHSDIPSPLKPTSKPFPILVWGGATAVGGFVVQFLKLAGLQTIATASSKNFDYLKSLGAEAVFDYRDPDVSKKIKDYTGGKLSHAVDCISEGETPKQVQACVGDNGGVVSTLLPFDAAGLRDDVKITHTVGYTIHGKDIPYWGIPEKPEDYVKACEYAVLIGQLLKEGKLIVTPIKVMPKGLASVEEGFKYMMDGKVSAIKLVYRIADTPA